MADGASLREDAVQVLAQFERMMERARASAAGMCGAIRVGYIIGAAVDIVPRVLRAHAEQCPDVQVQTTEFDFSRPAARLDNGCGDVAIVRPPIDVRGAQLRTLATEPRVACLPESHRLAERDEVSVYELLDEPIIAAPGHGPWRDYWLCCEYRGPRAACCRRCRDVRGRVPGRRQRPGDPHHSLHGGALLGAPWPAAPAHLGHTAMRGGRRAATRSDTRRVRVRRDRHRRARLVSLASIGTERSFRSPHRRAVACAALWSASGKETVAMQRIPQSVDADAGVAPCSPGPRAGAATGTSS